MQGMRKNVGFIHHYLGKDIDKTIVEKKRLAYEQLGDIEKHFTILKERLVCSILIKSTTANALQTLR